MLFLDLLRSVENQNVLSPCRFLLMDFPCNPLFQFLLPLVGLIAALGSISSCYYLKNMKGLIAHYFFITHCVF